ncbi:helix-turn-helix transcriptional regulator [Chitinophaga arvensicola]|uniref:AraC-type DNA-binding protein n=1 Tax=Chitinophaga arvensicola TaxID=29529 RepID=A0A1I0S799_9BACT|nr:AraC family transcriptional regulator [Chitinophaga arvensicola]SEW50119.1 AraC-type DNA-binding protein [Chitinophaga arvensicola]
MSQPATKYLLIQPGERICTRYECVPSYLQSQLIPNAKCFIDNDENGVIIDQQIEKHDLSIHYHLVQLNEGVELATIAPDKRYMSACISGFIENTSPVPMKMMLGKKEVNTQNGGTDTATMVTEKEFVVNFHVNLHLGYAKYLKDDYPIFKTLNTREADITKQPCPSIPYRLNEVNYQIMHRIRSCKLIGEVADVFFRRSALDFYFTYLRYLKAPAPLMLMEQHRQQLREIANFIIHHPSETTDKEDLCDRFHVATEFLEAPFEQEFLIPVEDLILQEKMAMAFNLITETSHTLSHIASIVKYNSWEELRMVFEKYYKTNIAELRSAQ